MRTRTRELGLFVDTAISLKATTYHVRQKIAGIPSSIQQITKPSPQQNSFEILANQDARY